MLGIHNMNTFPFFVHISIYPSSEALMAELVADFLDTMCLRATSSVYRSDSGFVSSLNCLYVYSLYSVILPLF